MQKQDKNSRYISLKKAANLCSYSHEYLGLRARQGKLKSLKLGSTWVTKEDWLKEYLAQIEERHHNAKRRIEQKQILAQALRPAFALLLIFALSIALIAAGFFSLDEQYLAVAGLSVVMGAQETYRGNIIIFKEYRQWVLDRIMKVPEEPEQPQKEQIIIKRIKPPTD